MTTFPDDPNVVDTSFQRLVRKIINGQATADEIDQARHSAGLSPGEAMLVAEFLRRETSVTLISEVSLPIC